MITVIGLGEKKGDLTFNGKKEIESAAFVVARTTKQAFGIGFNESLDDLYNDATDYMQFNKLALNRLLKLEKQYGDIVYAVAGDGFSDSTVMLLYKSGANIRHIAGASDIKVPYSTFLTLNAYDYALNIQLDSIPVMIHSLDTVLIASEIKLQLLKFFDFDTPILFFCGENPTKTTLEELDRQPLYNAFCRAFVIPVIGFDKKIYTYGDLIRILQHLTGDKGCPWDKAQTHQKICTNMIEEAYEAAAAMERGDIDNLIEELGDVMLQSVFNADIASRSGEFDIGDVVSTLCRKLYTRHTHIFGENTATNEAEALKHWEDAKKQEKLKDDSVKKDEIVALKQELADKYKGFPSLLKSQKVFKKLAKAQEDSFLCIKQNPENAFGKMLFDAVVACERAGIDAESTLNAYISQLLKE